MFIFKFEKLDNELDIKYGFYGHETFLFLFCFFWGALYSRSAQVLLLAVPNGIITGHAQGAIWNARDLT